jgi:DNA-binding transcriptional LysR family regulator
MRSGLGQFVMPRIARFLARYPDIEVIFKTVETLAEIDRQEIDVALMSGWPPARDFVVRPLAQTRIVVCASPEYWEREGKPDEPRALSHHHCIVILGGGGALLDHWAFEKSGERQIVDVRSNLLTHNQSWMYEAACAGAGVIRTTDLAMRRYEQTGLLVPVLADWEGLEAPTHFAAYRPSKRRSKLVRVFVDFAAEVFAEVEQERPSAGGKVPRVPRPESFGRAHGRQSTYVLRRRKASP